MDVHIRELRYFAVLAVELNFTRSAEILHISQPTLTKQITKLEAQLRTRLFDRDRRRVVLTPRAPNSCARRRS
ncbi:LysR family transcriptional regulator [Catenulispora yoronensis]